MANYIDKEELLNEFKKSKEKGEMTDRFLELILIMVDNISNILSYKNEEDRKDCKSSAILDILKYWNKYDETKSDNIFAYFTQCIKNGLAKQFNILHPESKINYKKLNDDL